MRVWVLPVILMLLVCCSCQSARPLQRDATAQSLFGPATMRIHPIFTRIRDWTGDGQPDGVEALLEFQDSFGDETKARGRVIFELFEYRGGWPDPRGRRLANPWIGSLLTAADQRLHWNRTSRTYSFQLAFSDIRPDRSYVLSALFEHAGGGRLWDRMILEAQPAESPNAPVSLFPASATAPATSPADQ